MRDVIVATHVPPYRESCWYEGKISDDNWAPFFVCGQVGEVLLWYSERKPKVKRKHYLANILKLGIQGNVVAVDRKRDLALIQLPKVPEKPTDQLLRRRCRNQIADR